MLNGHSMSIDEVVKELDTDLNKGLSVEEARSRLEKCGYNELQRKEHLVSPSTRFSYKLKYILLILFVITAVLSVFIPPLFRISLREYLVAMFP
jgi:magnesium-transporting ATPase (P-type)